MTTTLVARQQIVLAREVATVLFDVPADATASRLRLVVDTLKLWRGAKIRARWTRPQMIVVLALDVLTPHEGDPFGHPAPELRVAAGDQVRVRLQNISKHGAANVCCMLDLAPKLKWAAEPWDPPALQWLENLQKPR